MTKNNGAKLAIKWLCQSANEYLRFVRWSALVHGLECPADRQAFLAQMRAMRDTIKANGVAITTRSHPDIAMGVGRRKQRKPKRSVA